MQQNTLTIDEKEQVIAKIAHALNQAGVVWGAVSSYMLYKRGVCDTFNDLDIVVKPGCAQTASTVLLRLGETVEIPPSPMYQTGFFQKYEVDGVGVDLMENFAVVMQNGRVYRYLFDERAAPDSALVCGELVPLATLASWQMLYAAMRRGRRVRQIAEYYKTTGSIPGPEQMLEVALGLLPAPLGGELREQFCADPGGFVATE